MEFGGLRGKGYICEKKGMEEITDAIKGTVYIRGMIKSIYNFKAN